MGHSATLLYFDANSFTLFAFAIFQQFCLTTNSTYSTTQAIIK